MISKKWPVEFYEILSESVKFIDEQNGLLGWLWSKKFRNYDYC